MIKTHAFLLVVLAACAAVSTGAAWATDINSLEKKRESQATRAASPASSETIAADMDAWEAEFVEIVDDSLRFPLVGVLQRQDGTTGIRLLIDRSGRIDSATIEQASGSEDIDNVTKKFFEALTLPPLPDSYPHDKLSFLYTIKYTLH